MTMVGFLVTLIKAGLVFGLLALTIRMLRRYDQRAARAGSTSRPRRAGRGSKRRTERLLDVVERAPLNRSASVVLVRVRDQHWVLGVTEQQVSMLLEVDLPDEPETIDLRAEHDGPVGFAAVSWRELSRQAQRYFPNRTKVEAVSTPAPPVEGDPAGAAIDPSVGEP